PNKTVASESAESKPAAQVAGSSQPTSTFSNSSGLAVVIKQSRKTDLEVVDGSTLNLKEGEILLRCPSFTVIKTLQAVVAVRPGVTVLISENGDSCKVRNLLGNNGDDVSLSAQGKYVNLGPGDEGVVAASKQLIIDEEAKDDLRRKNDVWISSGKNVVLHTCAISLLSLLQSSNPGCLNELVNSVNAEDKAFTQTLSQKAKDQEQESRHALSPFTSYSPKETKPLAISQGASIHDSDLLALSTDSWQMLFKKSGIAENLGKYDVAEELLDKAKALLEKDPSKCPKDLSSLCLRQALICQRKGKIDDAVAFVDKSLMLCREDASFQDQARALQLVYREQLTQLKQTANAITTEPSNAKWKTVTAGASADMVLAGIIETYGGIERIKLFNKSSLEYRGTRITYEGSDTKKIIAPSSPWYLLTDANCYFCKGGSAGDRVSGGFDGAKCWANTNNYFYVFSKTERQLDEQSDRRSLYKVLEVISGAKPRLLHPRKIGDHKCLGLEFDLKSGVKSASVWCDEKTHLIVRTNLSFSPPNSIIEKDTNYQTDYDRYQLCAGYLIPFKASLLINDQLRIMTWEKVEFLPPAAVAMWSPSAPA
ncbi:MAG: hypothetical protein K2X81_29055, partial [Candidatus Obscuribacterales bacterium]|nr:hypothetical protein [Candidatus Obscuribacterales bacterium]